PPDARGSSRSCARRRTRAADASRPQWGRHSSTDGCRPLPVPQGMRHGGVMPAAPALAPTPARADGAAAALARLLGRPAPAEVGLLVTPADVGGAAAFQDLVHRGALVALWGDVAAPAGVPVTA